MSLAITFGALTLCAVACAVGVWLALDPLRLARRQVRYGRRLQARRIRRLQREVRRQAGRIAAHRRSYR